MERTFIYNGTKYTLTYTLDSIRKMEESGFVFDELRTKPASMIPVLFSGALMAKHKNLKFSEIDKIFNSLPKKEKLIPALIEMYSDTISNIIDEPEEAGNLTTEVDW